MRFIFHDEEMISLQFYINSERYLSNVEELTYLEVIKMSGYPLDNNYRIINEKSGESYKKDDIISISDNISLMITLER